MGSEHNRERELEGEGYTLERLREKGIKENGYASIILKEAVGFRRGPGDQKPKPLTSLKAEIYSMSSDHMKVFPYIPKLRGRKRGFMETIQYDNIHDINPVPPP